MTRATTILATAFVALSILLAAMHGAIRGALATRFGGAAEEMRILYGGSVNGENAAELLGAGDVDGALVGGASLTATKFVPIVAAAAALG
jgi:triosephosphate isomerase